MKLWQIIAVVGVGIVFGVFSPVSFAYALGHGALYASCRLYCLKRLGI